MWQPTKVDQLESRYKWLVKQAKQRLQTRDQKGVRHTRERVEQLENESKWFEEEAKRIKDLIEDGR